MTNILRIQNVSSWLHSSDKELKNELHQKLRFRDEGYYYSPAFKSGKWDGYKNFFDFKSGMFFTGLLPEVLHKLRELNKPFEVVDERGEAIQWNYKSIDENFLNPWLPEGHDPITLHDYQPDLVNKALRFRRGIIQAPTSAGKTFIMISLLKCLPPNTPTLFLTKNKQLVKQNFDHMRNWKIPDVGRWYDKFKEPNLVTCANINVHTLKSLEELLPKFKALIVDEVHEGVSDVPISAYKKMKSASVRIGVSATPYKDQKIHKFTVKSHFGAIFKTETTPTGYLTTKDLQERGILAKSVCVFYPINSPDISYEPYMDAVTLGIAENFHFHKVIRKLSNSLKGRTLILVERRDQGEYLKQLMPNAHWINGDDDVESVRQPVINALCKAKDVTAIVMRQIITAGIDIKIHNLINAAGGDADHNIIQQIGRGLRCASDKEILRFYDFVFNINPYLHKHSNNRIRTLTKQGHEVIVKTELDF